MTEGVRNRTRSKCAANTGRVAPLSAGRRIHRNLTRLPLPPRAPPLFPANVKAVANNKTSGCDRVSEKPPQTSASSHHHHYLLAGLVGGLWRQGPAAPSIVHRSRCSVHLGFSSIHLSAYFECWADLNGLRILTHLHESEINPPTLWREEPPPTTRRSQASLQRRLRLWPILLRRRVRHGNSGSSDEPGCGRRRRRRRRRPRWGILDYYAQAPPLRPLQQPQAPRQLDAPVGVAVP